MSPQNEIDFPMQELLAWFSKNQRPLPWRRQYPPYEVWVSEAMLQQTQVQQMLPYYARFLKRFPTIQKLASASEQEVLKAWEGLGYYSRCRNLHKASKQITSDFNGVLPQKKEELLQLPGFGEYIASAVASIAFNEPVAVVDGNVFRVLSRFFGIKSDIALSKTKKEFQLLASQLVPKKNARFFNQGLMELGALICLPSNPLCGKCPLSENCFARKNSKQESLPFKSKGPKKKTRVFAAVLVRENGKIWLEKRSEKLLQGLWQFPLVGFVPATDSKKELEKKFLQRYGTALKIGKEIGKIRHSYTHFHQIIVLFFGKVQSADHLELVGKKQLEKIPLSKANQKLLQIALRNNP